MHADRAGCRRQLTTFLALSAVSCLLASLPTGGASAAAPAGALVRSRPASATTAAIPDNIRLYRTRTSLLGTHRWYQQTLNDRVVYGGWYSTHTDRQGRLTTRDERRKIRGVVATTPRIPLAEALDNVGQPADTAFGDVTDTTLVVLPSQSPTGTAHLAWEVHTPTGRGETTTFVDAADGEILRVLEVAGKKVAATAPTRRLADSFSVTGRGRVFIPNPVVKLKNQNLRDRRDSNTAVPLRGYTVVDLPRLSAEHTLVGRWVRIGKGQRTTANDDRYLFRRADDRFEQVTAYNAIDAAQSYLQKLGFTDANAESQLVQVDAFAADNSYYDPTQDKLLFGRGGVDDAEDPEVVWHEYGHAIQADQVPGWEFWGQAGAIGEGFGDYMAVTMSQADAPDSALAPSACVMDWDATSYTTTTPHCLRRTDGSKMFPRDMVGEVHSDSEIWSRALWDINRKLGRGRATRVIVEAQFWMSPRSTMPEAARKTVWAAGELCGAYLSAKVRRQFVNRGILKP